VFNGTKLAVALLLSHEFAEWMIDCVEAKRETGFARYDVGDQVESLQQEQAKLHLYQKYTNDQEEPENEQIDDDKHNG
jgi:hypothetical protein